MGDYMKTKSFGIGVTKTGVEIQQDNNIKVYSFEYVVRAVNSHAAVIKALKASRDYFRKIGNGLDEEIFDLEDLCVIALAQAEGK